MQATSQGQGPIRNNVLLVNLRTASCFHIKKHKYITFPYNLPVLQIHVDDIEMSVIFSGITCYTTYEGVTKIFGLSNTQ